MTLWYRFWFLFTSFGPLYAVFAVKISFSPSSQGWAVGFAIAFAISFLVFLVVKSSFRRAHRFTITISDIKAKDTEIFGYLMAYIPPVIMRDLSDISVVAPLFILYAIIALSFMRLDSPYLNPYFLLFRYRLYEGKTPHKTTVTIIAKRRMIGTESTTVHEIGNGDLYYVE